MKKAPLSFLALLLFFASFTYVYATPISWDAASGVLQPLQSQWTSVVKGDHFTATSTTATNTFPHASTTQLTNSGSVWLTALTGLLKANGASAVTVAVNGTDYTLITANACSAGNHVSGITAAGVISCSADTGSGSSFSYPFPSNATTTVLTFSNGASVPSLTNLTSDGYVKTSGGNGTLSVQGVPIPVGDGGTGATSFTAGSRFVVSHGSSAFTDVAIPLTVSNGGTGSTTLTGLLKGAGTGIVATAVPGTDYTLITANTCGAGNHVSAITALGSITCSPDTGSGGTGLATTSPVSGGNLLEYSSGGAGSAFGVATTTLAGTGPISISNSPVVIGGSGAIVSCATATGSIPGCLSAADFTTFNGKQAAGNYITALTGDVTASGPGSVAATLKNTGPGAGSFTNSNITIDAQGRITAASNGSAGGTSLLTNVSANTFLNTGTNLQAPVLMATSTTGVSLITNALSISTTSNDAPITIDGTNSANGNIADFIANNAFSQVLSQNTSSTGSTGFTVCNDQDPVRTGCPNHYFEFGIDGSSFASQPSSPFILASSSADTVFVQQNANTGWAFFTGGNPGTQRFTIRPNGNVGVGTSTPTKTFSVTGESLVSATSTSAGLNVLAPTTGTSTPYIYSKTAGFGGSIILEDAGGGTCTQLTTKAGVGTFAVVTCPTEL